MFITSLWRLYMYDDVPGKKTTCFSWTVNLHCQQTVPEFLAELVLLIAAPSLIATIVFQNRKRQVVSRPRCSFLRRVSVEVYVRQSCLEHAAGRIVSLQHFAHENLLADCSFSSSGCSLVAAFPRQGCQVEPQEAAWHWRTAREITFHCRLTLWHSFTVRPRATACSRLQSSPGFIWRFWACCVASWFYCRHNSLWDVFWSRGKWVWRWDRHASLCQVPKLCTYSKWYIYNPIFKAHINWN